MEQHALAILSQSNLNWPITKQMQESGQQGRSKYSVPTAKFLYHLIEESQKFSGGTRVLDQFWEQLGACDVRLKENIESLREEDFVSAQKSFEVLCQGLDPQDVDFKPVLAMAAEFFTNLGIAFLNPGGPSSGSSTPYSVSEVVSQSTDKLLKQVNQEGRFGTRKQAALKALSRRRDGDSCLLTRAPFEVPGSSNPGIPPTLAHIIPNSVHGKPNTLKSIAMFAGDAALNDVTNHLNSIGNAMNMQYYAHIVYDSLAWGIEAKEEGGKVKYFFRLVPDPKGRPPMYITLKEGEEIEFGLGVDGKQLNYGPIPRLCNLQLAVARVLKMSGAADIILEWKDQADDDGCYRLFIDSEESFDMLDAKLFLSGKAIVA